MLPQRELRADVIAIAQGELVGRGSRGQARCPLGEPLVVCEAHDHDGPIAAVALREVVRELDDRHDTRSGFAQRLGDKLLDPQSEVAERPRSDDGQLVVAGVVRVCDECGKERRGVLGGLGVGRTAQ